MNVQTKIFIAYEIEHGSSYNETKPVISKIFFSAEKAKEYVKELNKSIKNPDNYAYYDVEIVHS